MKLRNTLSVLAIALATASCGDFLNLSDPDAITVPNFYASEDDIQASVFGAYDAFRDAYTWSANYYQENKAMFLVYPDTGVAGGENAQFYSATVLPTNTIVLGHWTRLYKAIDRANVVLKHLDDVTYANANTKATFEAEMRIVRAVCYYKLVCDYGAVPVVLTKLETIDEINAANKRDPKADVYAAIVADCDFAISSPLVDLQSAANCGRACKVAAYALKGKALLQQATDADFASQKSALLASAKTALEAAWSKAPFSDFKTVSYAEAFDVTAQAGAKDNIFQINYVGGSASSYSSFTSAFRPDKIDDPTKDTNNTNNYGGTIMPLTVGNALYDEPGDIRKEQFMATGSYRSTPCYYPLKFVDKTVSNAYYGCNFPVLRYADVALMLAEVAYHSSDATNAQKYLNLVRNRAGLGNSTATGTALRDAIYTERFRELMYESHAFDDMRRGYSAAEIVARMASAEFNETDLLLPIPYTQYQLNKEGLYQNPGYAI